PKLLTEISSIGHEQGLEFVDFTPGGEKIINFYAITPIKITLRGPYHQVALFFNRITSLHRIVTVSNIAIQPKKKELSLITHATVTIYRYLSPEERPKKKKSKKKTSNRGGR
ncbi:MAG: type 4a pilus biogenesis protein PilO, partial [Magnetococcales bacterium]|nr:type 4a pilus biogenesis protein PilO [Magnetococcales bacterium]